jgi:hypothetical protein
MEPEQTATLSRLKIYHDNLCRLHQHACRTDELSRTVAVAAMHTSQPHIREPDVKEKYV